MSNNFLFLDSETTGLDPHTDHVLEIAWILTDSEFSILDEYRAIINHAPFWDAVRNTYSAAPTVVREMHRKSGLWALAEGCHDEPGRAGTRFHTYPQVYDELKRTLQYTGKPAHLAGFSVHFDADFLKKTMSFGDLFDEKLLHHRYLDLSAIKMMLDSAEISWEKAGNYLPHRALTDAQESLDQADIFREMFKKGL